jgi:hypothetical protein
MACQYGVLVQHDADVCVIPADLKDPEAVLHSVCRYRSLAQHYGVAMTVYSDEWRDEQFQGRFFEWLTCRES